MTVGSKVRQTLATLRSVHSTLRLYSVQAQNDETEAVFKEALQTTNNVINDMQNRLTAIEFEEPQYKGK